MNYLLRSATLLAILGTSSAAPAWDEAEAPAAVSPVSPPLSNDTDGRTVYTVPILKQLWETQAVLNVTRDKVAHIANDENAIFVQSTAGVVTALNAESGRQFWSAQVGRSDEVAMKATSDGQLVAVVAGPTIHAFDKFSGQKLFSYRLPTTASGPPLITRREFTVGNRVNVIRNIFVPIADTSLVAYNIEDLEYIGRHGTLKPRSVRALDWRFAGGELIREAPVAGQERLAFATEAGNIHVVDMFGATKGKSRFQFLMNSKTTAPLTVITRDDNEYLLAACDNNRIFCIALKSNGDMNWTMPMSRPVAQPMCVVGNDVYALTDEGQLMNLNLMTGQHKQVVDGVRAVIAHTEGAVGQLPAYGAMVELETKGFTAFEPIRITNGSTGQTVNSIVVNLKKSRGEIAFALNDQNEPRIRIEGSSAELTGYRSMKLSDDQKELTIEFTDFNPGEQFSFFADFQHLEVPEWQISDSHLTGSVVKALVSPIRASVVASKQTEGRVEPFPPRTIVGEIAEVTETWEVSGVKSLAAVSENAIYLVNLNDELLAVNRKTGKEPRVFPVRDYSIHVVNNLTDRVYLSTESGRVACFTESRIELGAMMLPAAGCVSWLLYPKSELAAEFAAYHQNPNGRPLTVDVPKTDPAKPAPAEEVSP